MKILLSLCLPLSLISSIMLSVGSPSFNQPLHNMPNRNCDGSSPIIYTYKVSSKSALKMANISLGFLGIICCLKTECNISRGLFLYGAGHNIGSAFIDNKGSKKSIALGVGNAFWGLANTAMFVTSVVNIMDQGVSPHLIFWALYYSTKAAANVANATTRLWYIEKE